MVSLSWLNISFLTLIEFLAEIIRITLALTFQAPPPEHTFRALEPLYKGAIERVQARCEKKAAVLAEYKEKACKNEVPEAKDVAIEERTLDELEELLHRHSRLVTSLAALMQHPYLHPRSHDDSSILIPDADQQLGRERYINPPVNGYGFSNDYIRQWLAAIPGPLGRHFEREEAGKVNLTEMVGRVVVAIVGGGALLAPMILMTFIIRPHWRLVIVSVATVLFGIAFAVVSRSKENVLAGTAAYAAVMVVYIGSASGSG